MIVLNHDLRISGALAAANIASGQVTITPVANTPTSIEVSGLALAGAGTTRAFATANTLVPGSTVLEVSTTSVTETGFLIWVYRTNTTATIVRWWAIRDRE